MRLMIIPAGYSQVNLKFGGVAVPLGAEMTFGVENPTAMLPGQIADFVGDTLVGNAFAGFLVTGSGLISILVKNGPNATGPSEELGYIIAGTQSGAGGGAAVSVLISKVTALGGRKGRGRMFQPGVTESVVDPGGVLQTVHATALNTCWTGIKADLAAGDLPMHLLHGDATAPTEIVNLNVQTVVATQRRRQRR